MKASSLPAGLRPQLGGPESAQSQHSTKKFSGKFSGRLCVQKFGGTSVGTPDRIRAIADRLAEQAAAGDSLVIVVSAMGNTTDELIDLAHQISVRPPHREMDMLLTVGERISMALLSMALSDRGVDAVSFTGSQTGIITNESHRRAKILHLKCDRVRAALEAGKVVIVAGFQGVSESKEITTLGRGGSDTTAVALAVALQADRCEIYTDVDGIYSADPRIVPEARFWPRLPAELMEEMAVLGAGVLHPRCVQIARAAEIPIWVKNSQNQKAGTEVMAKNEAIDSKPGTMEDFRVVAVTADSDKALVTVQFMRPTVSGSIWALAEASHLSIVAPMVADGVMRFFAAKDSAGEWRKQLGRLVSEGFVKEFRFEENYVPLSVIGNRFSEDGAALSRVFDRLTEERIEVTQGASTSTSMTLAVPSHLAEQGVRVLHQLFFGAESS